jgi:signal transduction histidine kinase
MDEQATVDVRWQDALTFIRDGPLAETISLCMSELRTPLTAVLGSADLLVRLGPQQYRCQALARSILAYSTVLADAYITDELLDFRRLLIMRFPALHAASWAEAEPPIRQWQEPLDQALLELVQRMCVVVEQARVAAHYLQNGCESALDPLLQPLPGEIERHLARVLVVVDRLLAGALIERIRYEQRG